MTFNDLKDKAISIIVWNTEKENDVHVYLGCLQMELDEIYFLNEEKGWKIHLDDEQLSRLKPVDLDSKTILLNADFALSMSMSDLPQQNSQDYNATGMKWNS